MFKSIFLAISILIFVAACTSDVEFKAKDIEGVPIADLSNTYSYVKDTPYNEDIAACIQPVFEVDLCTLETLPFIGMDTDTPSVSDIMSRLVVSHDWMGERFEAVLDALPTEMLPLFKAVTAVVIDDDIRPAYYTRGTGAIYLDPAYLWLSTDDKRTINLKPDYRSNFGSELSFEFEFLYLNEDGDNAFSYGNLFDDSTRELDDIILLVSRLLLHELAHANDMILPTDYAQLDSINTAYYELSQREEVWLSTNLKQDMPLTSSTMFRIASILHLGTTAEIEDIHLTASEVAEAFDPDGATHTYSYASQFEDLAMLFEMSMMKYFYNIDSSNSFYDLDENTVWSAFNRVGASQVKVRAEYIASEILNETDLTVFFQNYPDVVYENSPTSSSLRSSINSKGSASTIPYL